MKSLLAKLVELSRTLPPSTLDTLATALERLPPGVSIPEILALQDRLTQPGPRAKWQSLLTQWAKESPTLLPATVAMGLRAAAACDEQVRQEQHIDLVWTGPPTLSQGLQRIDQTLFDLINGAEQSLLLVTFAAYRAEIIRQALLAAVRRGVNLGTGGGTPNNAGREGRERSQASL